MRAFRRPRRTRIRGGSKRSVEYRWADGHYDRLPSWRPNWSADSVAAIVATGGRVSGSRPRRRRQRSRLCLPAASDPVKLGLVASLNRPGGNVTGVNLIFGALGAKRLELLRDLDTGHHRDARQSEYSKCLYRGAGTEAGARSLGVQLHVFNAKVESEFERAFSAITAQRIAGLLVGDDPFLQGRRDQLVQLAANHAIPAIYFSREFSDAGGLMSYGPSLTDAYRLVGFYIGRILKGEKPADLPVIQPTKFDLVINLKTAKALELTVRQRCSLAPTR